MGKALNKNPKQNNMMKDANKSNRNTNKMKKAFVPKKKKGNVQKKGVIHMKIKKKDIDKNESEKDLKTKKDRISEKRKLVMKRKNYLNNDKTDSNIKSGIYNNDSITSTTSRNNNKENIDRDINDMYEGNEGKKKKTKEEREKERQKKESNLRKISKILKENAIKNKMRRKQLVFINSEQKKKERKTKQLEKKKKNLLPQTPDTIESLRRYDETVIDEKDKELLEEENIDEYSDYFSQQRIPKIMITTNKFPSKQMYNFLKEIVLIIPNCYYFKRGPNTVKEIVKYARNAEYTDLIVITENRKQPHGLYISHLPNGPTSYFRITSLLLAQDMKGGATSSTHQPEILLNNFDTRLGRRVARILAALFPITPDFVGRRLITFHNQRDFIFFRHHRYIFNKDEDENDQDSDNDENFSCENNEKNTSKNETTYSKTRLQEIGPRFTLKLMYIHSGTFNTKHDHYEFIWRPDIKIDRKKMLI